MKLSYSKKIILITILIAQSIPLIWLAYTSFTSQGGFLLKGSQSRNFTLENFQILFLNTDYLKWAINSVALAGFAATLACFGGITFAFAVRIKSLEYSWISHIRTLVLVSYLIPPLLYIFPLQYILPSKNMLLVLFSLGLTFQLSLFPLAVWLGSSYIERIPTSIIALARLEQRKFTWMLSKILLPFSGTSIPVVYSVAFVISFQEYLFSFIFLRRPSWQTLPVGLAGMQAGDIYEWILIASGGIMTAIICLAILFIVGSRVMTAAEKAIDRIS